MNKTVLENEQQQETAAALEASLHRNMSGGSNTAKGTGQAERANEYVEKSKAVSKMYLKYAWDILKKPNQQAFRKDQSHLLNGAISASIFSVFFSLAVYFMLRKIMSVSLWGVPIFKITFFDGAVMPFIVIAILIAVVATALYGALMLQKIKVSYKEILSQWLTYLVIPAALSVIAFVLALIGISQLSSLLLGLSIIAMFGSVPIFICGYQQGKPSELDPLYITLAIYAVVGIIFSIIGNGLMQNLLGAF